MTERQELHLLYRPQNFDEYIGGDALKEAVLSCVDRTRTFLFHGPRGCGKTSLARLIAAHLKIHESDIHEIDAADKTGIDDARQIKSSASYAPMGGSKKIYIIDEVHRLSGNAWDSLLKTLEQPPNHCYFVLCTTELSKVPITIKSRAKSFEVKPLVRKDASLLLEWVCENEQIKLSDPIKNCILDNCEGIPREIIITIDTVRDIKKDEDAIELIASAKYNPQIIDLCRALIAKKKWSEITAILSSIADEPESIRYAVLGYMNSVLMKSDNAQAAVVIMCFTESFMYSKKAGLTMACYSSIH